MTNEVSKTIPDLFAGRILPQKLRERLDVYKGKTLQDFQNMLDSIRFISCGKEHEFGDQVDANCKLRGKNGRCAHQREYTEISDLNVATLVSDTLLFGKAMGIITKNERRAAEEIIKRVRRDTGALDVDAAIASGTRTRSSDGEEMVSTRDKRRIPLSAFRGNMKLMEEAAASPMEPLVEKAKGVFKIIVTTPSSPASL